MKQSKLNSNLQKIIVVLLTSSSFGFCFSGCGKEARPLPIPAENVNNAEKKPNENLETTLPIPPQTEVSDINFATGGIESVGKKQTLKFSLQDQDQTTELSRNSVFSNQLNSNQGLIEMKSVDLKLNSYIRGRAAFPYDSPFVTLYTNNEMAPGFSWIRYSNFIVNAPTPEQRAWWYCRIIAPTRRLTGLDGNNPYEIGETAVLGSDQNVVTEIYKDDKFSIELSSHRGTLGLFYKNKSSESSTTFNENSGIEVSAFLQKTMTLYFESLEGSRSTDRVECTRK